MSRGFAHVDTWIFDLDNTLYPASCRLFDQIDERMGAYVATLLNIELTEARRIQKSFFHEHGTTLRGLMDVHDIDPQSFLAFVHDIDHTPIAADPVLAAALTALPGRRLVFTNGTVRHAECVLDRLGVKHLFADIFDIVHSGYVPKPSPEPYRAFIAKNGLTPRRAAMFEDIARNLETPHALGMTTVLVQSPHNHDGNLVNSWLGNAAAQPFIHHVTDDLGGFLERVAASLQH
jgi:putative hydrolase of the HAD superfamily